MSVRDYLTIGEVVQKLESTYSDLSISKVRFLEEEGLISPERTQGGYRKFRPQDISRLETILVLQRDHFLPLAVIREKLAELDRGRIPAELQRSVAVPGESVASVSDEGPVPIDSVPAEYDIPASFVSELAGFGLLHLVDGPGGECVSRSEIGLLHSAWELRRFGVEPRHLRMYDNFAEREAALFSQILLPMFKHRTPDSRQRLAQALKDLVESTDALKTGLLNRALNRLFEEES